MATYSSIKQSVLEAASIARVIATNYNSVDSLPTSGNAVGEQALVLGDSSTDRLYIWEGSAWYQIALIQNSPTFTTSPDASYELATDGVTTTVITLAATDPEGFPVTFSAVTNVGFDSIATVSQDSSVFTITPFSQDSAGVSRSGTITFKASDGISVASAISTFTVTFKIVNSNFTSTLIKASGNNGTNTAINDASSHNRTITKYGNIRTQAFTPHHPGGYSAYFDGSGDSLSIGDTATTEFGSGDFTIEFWYNGADTDQYATLTAKGAGSFSSGNWSLMMNHSVTGDIALYVANYSTSGPMLITGDVGINDNNWNHIAVVRYGNNWNLYVNGVSEASRTSSITIADTTSGVYIGKDQYYGRDLSGYISDYRIVKGTAVYTSGFTPPTERLTAISGTSLLVCHLPYLADGSSNDHAVTFAGNVALKRFGPYDHVAYDASIHGASIYNDGSGDYMTTPADTTHLTLDGDFTIDFWYYPVAAKNMGYVYGKWNNNSDGWAVWVTPNYSSGNFGYVTFYYGNYGSNECASNLRSTVVTLNQWHYIRITRSSNTMYMSVNGKVGTRTNYTSGITFTDNRTFNANATMNMLGGSVGNTLGIAYLSDLRVINGTALTTGNFTPPTSPVTAVTNTKLLTCNDAPDVFDAAGGERRLKTNGNAKSSTAQTKNAESSIVFDGSGDTITIAEQVPRNERDDWTIEFWVRPNNVTNRMDMFSQYNASSAGRMTLNMNNSGIVNFFQNGLTGNSGSSISSSSSLTANVWQHIAVTNNNGVRSMFIDGEYQGQSTGSQAMADLEIMIGNAVDRTDYMNGYMEDIRLTKGLSRYPFIPFSETLTSNSNTTALLCHADTIVDGSSSAASITTSGDPTVSNFGPHPGMKSVYFDGNDYFNLETTALGSGDFTVEAWVYSNDFGDGSYNQIFSFRPSNGSNSAQGSLAFNGSGGLVWWTNTFIIGSSSSGPHFIDSTWNHFALVRDNGTLKIFVNGTMTNSVANTQNLSEASLSLGANNNGSEAFTGYISNFRISSTVQYTNSFTVPTEELEA